MAAKLKVLLASRSKPAIDALRAKLAPQPHYEIHARHVENGHADPLYGLSFDPDVVVLALNERGLQDLAELTRDAKGRRPPMVVIAEHGDARTMRLAMQAGARDFLPGAIAIEDVVASIDRAAAQAVKLAGSSGALTAVVNAKGGSGATFVAANLAHLLSAASGHSTALVSLDLQFESLAQFFDGPLKHDLVEVLENVNDLDAVALDGYMTEHESGLRLLAAKPRRFEPHVDRSAELAALLDKATSHYERVVVDLPRRVDVLTPPVLERADRVVLVVQQTVSHLRDATRMVQIVTQHGVAKDQILAVVNRFEKRSQITMDDVQRALSGIETTSIPSDFKTVAESIDLGVPMHAHARASAVTKSLGQLATMLGARVPRPSGGLLGKAFSSFLRKD